MKNEEIEIVCGNETNAQKSTQSDIFIHVLMSQSQSIENGDQINANICFFHVQQRQVYDFIYTWAKENVKQKSSVKPNVKLVHLFFPGLGRVGKSHLIKTIYQLIL